MLKMILIISFLNFIFYLNKNNNNINNSKNNPNLVSDYVISDFAINSNNTTQCYTSYLDECDTLLNILYACISLEPFT